MHMRTVYIAYLIGQEAPSATVTAYIVIQLRFGCGDADEDVL